MWATTYQHKNVRGVITSGGLGPKEELIAFDVGDKEVVDMILRRDPAIFDFLVDAVINVKDLSDLMWSDESDYYVERIMPEKYNGDKEALKERIEYLISVAPKFKDVENGVKNFRDYLAWLAEQEAKEARKQEARSKAKIVRKELQRDYDKLFMTIGRRDGFCCAECGAVTDLTIDHKLAVINGGTNDPENLQLMCKSHNSSKGAR